MYALDREMLTKFAAHPRGITITELFDGFNPMWAVNAAHLLIEKSLVTRDEKGVYRVTDEGWAAFQSGAAPAGTFNGTRARTERDVVPAGGLASSAAGSGRRTYRK